MVEQLFTAKRRRIEAEIVTTNRSREFLPVPHSPKDLDSRPSTIGTLQQDVEFERKLYTPKGLTGRVESNDVE